MLGSRPEEAGNIPYASAQGRKTHMKLVPRIWGPLTALALIVGCGSQDATDVASSVDDGFASDTAETASDETAVPSEEGAVEFGQVQEALSFTSLPPCRFFNEGLVYYVHTPSNRVGFYYCRSNEWRLISTGTGGGTGVTGPTGPAGATGPRGATGANGSNGSNGATGPRGATGANGSNGSNGATGPAGATGARGATGAQGIPGPTGPAGGGTGASGPAQLVRVTTSGACKLIEIGIDDNRNGTLETAEVDSSGQVCDGATGATGARGATGANGTNGTNGSNGSNGATGPTGPQGANGSNGSNGSNGATGPTGPQGPQGPQGVQGVPGTNGSNGSNGSNGATGPTGPQGIPGTNGSNGSNGSNGATGPQGPTGPTGPTGPAGGGTTGPTGPATPVCGNSVVEQGEQCDLGAANSATGACSVNCQNTCLPCIQTRCPDQYNAALGTTSTASNTALVTQLLDCVVGPNWEAGGAIPSNSCYFANPLQPRGTLIPCYCGNTPEATCLASGPSNNQEACGLEMELASQCSPVTASCVTGPGSNPAVASGDVLQLLNCAKQAAACESQCGFPPVPPED